MVRFVLDVAVRAAVFVGVHLVFAHLVSIPGDDDGLGTGLVAFATFVLLAAGWGGYDGWRRSLRRVLALWLLAPCVAALGIELLLQADSDQRQVSVVDALGELWFFAVLFGFPALVVGSFAAVVTPQRRSASP